MSKPIILAVGGALAGVGVAFAVFMFVLGGPSSPAAAAAPAEVVNVPGKLGPHITLADRVFNLLTEPGQPPTYLKLQTVVEFETKDQRWARVLSGCGASAPHGAAMEGVGLDGRGDVLVSAAPGGRPAERVLPAVPGGGDPCEAEQAALLAEFEREIGTGRALIEDVVTTIVTGHTASEIATPAGKEALKAEIATAIGELMHDEPRVTRVLFLNFITQ